ncbi:ATPase V [Burkholderia sp. 572]|uniref:ATPase V n=1 Tax=Burkholderia sp. 572 TaxID=3156414 RepID=UPI0033916E43
MYFRVMKAAIRDLDALADTRVIKAGAFAELLDAINLRDSLKAEVEQAQRDRKVAVDDARREGYAQGEREAQSVVAEHLNDAHCFLARAHSLFESQFARFVATAVERIVEPLPENTRMQAVIRHAYAAFGNEVALRIVVHPDDRDAAMRELEQLRPDWQELLADDVLLARGACRLESPLVVVEHEWEALRESIEQAALATLRDAAPFSEVET